MSTLKQHSYETIQTPSWILSIIEHAQWHFLDWKRVTGHSRPLSRRLKKALGSRNESSHRPDRIFTKKSCNSAQSDDGLTITKVNSKQFKNLKNERSRNVFEWMENIKIKL